MSFRNHAQYHERTLDQQILDVLLRIEEVLSVIAKRATAKTELVLQPEPPKGKRK